MTTMSGKVCLVAGGTSGIGWETATRLAELGTTVVVAGRDAERGRAAPQLWQGSSYAGR